jgi:aspartate carbamoyltransferase regulatory subunit
MERGIPKHIRVNAIKSGSIISHLSILSDGVTKSIERMKIVENRRVIMHTVSMDEFIKDILSLLSGKYLTRAISSPSIESKHRSLIADTIAEDNPTASAG